MTWCVFCAGREPVWSNDLAMAVRDSFPVSKGHTLVISRRHAPPYFEATPEERLALWEGVAAVKSLLDQELNPDGYNVGFNAGQAAGQTIAHLHIHIIPRFTGDTPNPAGGIRGVIPEKQSWRVEQ